MINLLSLVGRGWGPHCLIFGFFVVIIVVDLLRLADWWIAVLFLPLGLPISQVVLVRILLSTIFFAGWCFLIPNRLRKRLWDVLVSLWLINLRVIVLTVEWLILSFRLVKSDQPLAAVELEAFCRSDASHTSIYFLRKFFLIFLRHWGHLIELTASWTRSSRVNHLLLRLKSVVVLDLPQNLISLLEALSKNLLVLLLLLLLLEHLQKQESLLSICDGRCLLLRLEVNLGGA